MRKVARLIVSAGALMTHAIQVERDSGRLTDLAAYLQQRKNNLTERFSLSALTSSSSRSQNQQTKEQNQQKQETPAASAAATAPVDSHALLHSSFAEGLSGVMDFLQESFLSRSMKSCLCGKLPEMADKTWEVTGEKFLESGAAEIQPLTLLNHRVHAGEFMADTAHGIAADGGRVLHDQAYGKYCDHTQPEVRSTDFLDKSLSLFHHALTMAMTRLDEGSVFSNSDKPIDLRQRGVPMRKSAATSIPTHMSLLKAHTKANSTMEASTGSRFGALSRFGTGLVASAQQLSSVFSGLMGACLCDNMSDLVGDAWRATAGGALATAAQSLEEYDFMGSGVKVGGFLADLSKAVANEGKDLATDGARSRFCGSEPMTTEELVNNAQLHLQESFQKVVANQLSALGLAAQNGDAPTETAV